MKVSKEQIKDIETLAPVASPSFTGTPKAPVPSQSEQDSSRIATVGFVRTAISSGEITVNTYTVDFIANRWNQDVMDFYIGGGTDYDILFLDLDSMDIFAIPAFGNTPVFYAETHNGDHIETFNPTWQLFVVNTIYDDVDYHVKTLTRLSKSNWPNDTEDCTQIDWENNIYMLEPRLYDSVRRLETYGDVSVEIPWQFFNTGSAFYADNTHTLFIDNNSYDASITVTVYMDDIPSDNRQADIELLSTGSITYNEGRRECTFEVPAQSSIRLKLHTNHTWADPYTRWILYLEGQLFNR